MEQKDFHRILRRYLEGRASAEEEKIIDAGYEAMGKGSHSPLSGLEESALEKRYWSAISARIRGTNRAPQAGAVPKISTIKMMTWYAVGIAASVLLLVASYLFMIDNSTSAEDALTQNRVEVWTYLENTLATTQRFDLPDGSHITLAPQSRFRYSSSFNQSRREVFLEGEALFEVHRDKQRPFFVYAKEVTTMVLGTSFHVKAFDEDTNITVAVRTGSVSVYTNLPEKNEQAKENEIILTPNQQIIYNRNEKTIRRRIVEEPRVLLSEEKIKRMRFEEAPVKEIFEAIEKAYGVDIVFDAQRFSSCALTTSISDGGIYNRLDIICKAIGAEYTFNENQIVITGPGCN
jgi:transmembrane sensor